MSKENNKTAAKKNKKKKPLRLSKHWGAEVLPMAGRLATVLVAIVVLGMMFSALQAIESMWLRAGLSLLIASGLLLLCFNEGIGKGAEDAASSRNFDNLLAKGAPLTDADDAGCYHPLKAVCAGLVVFGIPLVFAVYIALTSQAYTYQLQDLPVWLTDTYGSRGDLMAPLGAYMREANLVATDWIRMIVRLMEMIYINVFPDPQLMGQLIDRLSPLMVATYPAVYVIGYLVGPRSNRKREKLNRRAKKIAVHRAGKKNLAAELTGVQNAVHYGQKVQDGKHKKKELV
ncbi:MAG: hypothetical protein IJN79_01825 [Clostridia bacterium]|nr:hypothetical protein [Clostridia bacterium]MBQ7051524.1 hypothetical protein [Clostridia bacterium]